MLKAIGTLQLAVAPLFVVPAMTSQDGAASEPITGQTLNAQLDATLASIEYLAGLRSAARAGDDAAVRAIVNATEAPRDATPQRNAHLATLQDDLARLRFQLDRLLGDPDEVAIITAMPESVVKALGLGGTSPSADADDEVLAGRRGITTPAAPGSALADNATGSTPELGADLPLIPEGSDLPNPLAARPDSVQGTAPTIGSTKGLDAGLRAAMSGDLAPLDFVSDSSRRRGNEPVALEDVGYVADPVHLGKLLVRAGRPAEAIEILKSNQGTPGASYWLARALQDQDRETEAIALFRLIADDGTAGIYSRHAAQDLEFLEFKSALKKK